MNRALVSIVTPSLNQGLFIEATLRSVMHQEYARVEHLVRDAGSADGTHEILRKYAGRYNLRWLSEPDEGMYDAINKGLATAKGEILGFLNTDDSYLPWTVASVVEAFDRFPDVDFVYGDVVKVDETAGSTTLVFAPPVSDAYIERLGSLFQPTVFWRRSVVDQLGYFDTSLRLAGDLEYWIRAVRANHRFRKLDEVLAIERIHPAAKSSAQAAELSSEEAAVRARFERWPEVGQRASRLWERTRAWAWRRSYWLAFASAVRRRQPVGRWAHFVRACEPVLHPLPLVASQLPVIGRRFVSRAIDITLPAQYD